MFNVNDRVRVISERGNPVGVIFRQVGGSAFGRYEVDFSDDDSGSYWEEELEIINGGH